MRIRICYKGCSSTILYIIILTVSFTFVVYHKKHLPKKSNDITYSSSPDHMVTEAIFEKHETSDQINSCLFDYMDNYAPITDSISNRSEVLSKIDLMLADLNQVKWRRLSPHLSTLFVLSAFYIYDTLRGNHSIRIVGVINDQFDVNDFRCHTCFENFEMRARLNSLLLNSSIAYEHYNKTYKTVFLDCSLGHVNNYNKLSPIHPRIVVISTTPSHVSSEGMASVVLKVEFGHLIENFTLRQNDTLSYPVNNNDLNKTHYIEKIRKDYDSIGSTRSAKLAVCVKPIYGDLNSGMRLVEFVEMYKLLGATSVRLYTHDTSLLVDDIIRMYQNSGLIEVIKWNLPEEMLPRNEKVFLDAQTAAFQDCAYHYKHRSTYVAMVDLDEFILPTKEEASSILSQRPYRSIVSLLELLEEVKDSFGGINCGSYQFRNVFYDINACAVNLTSTSYKGLTTLSCLWRQSYIYGKNVRSKEIINPDMVADVGNHMTRTFIYRIFRRCRVSKKRALNRHYRIPMLVGRNAIVSDVIYDDSALLYKNDLWRNVHLAQRHLGIYIFER